MTASTNSAEHGVLPGTMRRDRSASPTRKKTIAMEIGEVPAGIQPIIHVIKQALRDRGSRGIVVSELSRD